ncbi:MAG TPA: DUF3224 domain-containing protein [Candidatus Limnocylindrales bacterium]|nr:DUF3224 domain-containing protein [Candidatus Limnocylindrales bacterium]
MTKRATTTKLAGTFEVQSWTEEDWPGADHTVEDGAAVRLTHVVGTERFEGDIEGDGTVSWLMCYLPSGGARFVGLQRIEGWVGGRAGSLVLESSGDHDGAASRGTWSVVSGAGSGALEGVRGGGRFVAPGGRRVEYELTLDG